MNRIDVFKQERPITMVTCYDSWSAHLLNDTEIDAVLVGDSLAMVCHGDSDTIGATTELMALHAKAVASKLKDKFIIADLPFLSYRKSLPETMNAVEKLMKAGAHAIKLEGGSGNFETVRYIVESGVPVMGHLGLTPQFVHQFGGFKVQGKSEQARTQILEDAKKLEAAGCFSIVLEAVPSQLAESITKTLSIPTIGIGAGSKTSGQILVLHDLLGLQTEFKPKFVRTYLEGADLIKSAINHYVSDVQSGEFPSPQVAYE